MDESYLRRWHRRMGIILACFLALQALSGLVLTWQDVLTWPTLLQTAWGWHRGGGGLGFIYRTLLGMGLLGMATSGTLIFLKIRQRQRKS